MELIVLGGFARTGKDEAAKALVERHGFTQVAFADKLREVLYNTNPYTVANSKHHGPLPDGYSGAVYRTVQSVIDEYGWGHYKDSPFSDDLRRLLQRMGTEGGRKVIGENVWVDATLNNITADKVVISDGRFFNEFDAVRAKGGYVWRIERDGVGPLNRHRSETEAIKYPHYSLYLHNTGTLEQWQDLVSREYTSGRYREWGTNPESVV